ncbi:DUF2207 domain-containing protein [Paenibacillus xylanexedens]|uniref:DUF2207 domain-containing protein n=1 Tax=Paenibacillus xylanexedens TaxID=528191 RepID=UPI000FA386BF|nr:DUF2207 domain-containing protein [Paenibacillus xylanexedens]RPK24460.1 hypothetical protein EDO6_05404 [Paenibacillus xylanexedens]
MNYVLSTSIASTNNQVPALAQGQAVVLQDDWILRISESLMWVLLAMFILQCLIWIRNYLSKGTYLDEEVEQADPLFLAYLRSKGRLKLRDTQASLFQLTRSRVLSLRIVQAKKRYRNDKYGPNTTLEYRSEQPDAAINADERLVLQWMLKEYSFGQQRFRLDALAGPSSQQSSQSEEMQHYRRKEKVIGQGLEAWKISVLETRQDWNSLIRTPLLLRLLVMLVFPVLFILTCALCFTNGAGIQEGIALAVTLVLWLVAVKRIRVRWPYQLASVGLLVTITLSATGESAENSMFIGVIILSLLLRLILPIRVVGSSARDWAISMRRWRRRYKKGIPVDRLHESAESMERILQTALVLGIGSRCARKTDWSPLQNHVDPEIRRLVQLKAEQVDSVPVSSTLTHAPLLALALHLRGVFRPMLAAEYPYERLNYVTGTLETGSSGSSTGYSGSSTGHDSGHSHHHHHHDSSGGHHHGSDHGDSGDSGGGDSGGGGD